MSKMYPKLPKGVTLDRDWRTNAPRYYFRAKGAPKGASYRSARH